MEKRGSAEVLHELATQLDVDLITNDDYYQLNLNSLTGSGSLRAVPIFSGLDVLSAELILQETVTLSFKRISEAYLHFLFIEEGHMLHRFQHADKKRSAYRYQNVIVGSNSKDYSSFELPANVKLRFVLITLQRTTAQISGHPDRLRERLLNTLNRLSRSNSYTFFGDFSTQASGAANKLLNTVPSDISTILELRAAVFQLLSIQFQKQEASAAYTSDIDHLSKPEILAVLKISEFISRNLDKSLKLNYLERESGLNQKVIQHGFQQFYEMTVNKYILNLRVIKAKELIEKTELSIAEIVDKIGLNSRSYFSKVFTDKYGMQPNTYRKNLHLSDPTYELSYYSKTAEGLTNSAIISMVNVSSKNNKKLDITGCLVYHKNHFFQLLEGSKKAVEDVYRKIYQDARHKDVILLYRGFKSGRIFDNWHMTLIGKPTILDSNHTATLILGNVELVLAMNLKEMKSEANRLKAKLMWERVRNALLVKDEEKASLV